MEYKPIFPISVCVILSAILQRPGLSADPAPSFNRDIRPILASNCFECHGPDEDFREADLRLDTSKGATADLGGYSAIKPGNPQSSEMIRRMISNDPDEKMPPPDSGKTLTAGQIDLLRRWIASGGKYERHWAFIPPKRPTVPEVKFETWPKNEIDHFVLHRLEAEGLQPAPEANRYTLVRRLYLDLIGLPPSPEEADDFVNDRDPKAYEKLVDRLLKSKHYGERWARQWLDLARYADSNGYEKDRSRSIWPYRDWVIRALNDDMPFDQFTIEQLAGDMLPDATRDQRIATGFHRNTMLNEEGGIDPLEYRFYAMIDRVATTGTVWMGLTVGCAQCHTHKYDPITQIDYYRMMALLNNADEPDLNVPDPEVSSRRRTIEEQIAHKEAELPDKFPPAPGDEPIEERRRKNLQSKFAAWLQENRAQAVLWTILRPHQLESNRPKLELLADGSIFSRGDITKRDVFQLMFRLDDSAKPVTALRLEILPDERLPAGGPGRAFYEGRKGDFFLSEITATVDGMPARFIAASHSYGKISVGSGNANAENVFDGNGSTGWSTSGREGEAHQLVLNFAKPVAASSKLKLEFVFERHFAASLGRFRLSVTSVFGEMKAKQMPVKLEALLTRDSKSWTEAERSVVKKYFLDVTPDLAEARKPIEKLRRQLPLFPTTMVMQERQADNPRETFRHHRGEYLQIRDKVTPGVLEIFASLNSNEPADRLAFARWIVSDRNPLVGRVTVNRAWRALFGSGLMRTSGDFGTQSDPPTHPELLDWLAFKFVEQGWSMKKLHRLIVTSATYRQSSRVTPKLLQRDPENRLLARGPRVRVEAEMVRDIMLKASGLLSPKVGGPSVYPPQPATVTALAYGNTKWIPSAGQDRYRRSLYTFSKRTAPFNAYQIFDAPTGENCIARRDNSNTPLQALTLLNDDMFLEMARFLAKQAVTRKPAAAEQHATFIFRRFLTRPPTERELKIVLKFMQIQKDRLDNNEIDPAIICKDKQATPELAVWVLIARAVMNLDETITKQ
jgi:hypothetical protein